MGKFIDRTGESIKNKQGLKMSIVRYGNFDDIDVKFEDDVILKNKSYTSFKSGGLKNDNYNHPDAKINMIGEKSINNKGLNMEIIRYGNTKDIDIIFENGYIAKNKAYSKFLNGNVKNRLYESVHNIGYIGEGYIKTSHKCGDNLILDIWESMLQRCCDDKILKRRPTYKDCTVCEEWKCFQNFAEFYINEYYKIDNEKMCLDKDILIKGNKLYSPQTCLIVPQRINSLFSKADAIRGMYPLGVYYNKKNNKYIAAMSIKTPKSEYIGSFNTPEEAFYAYKKRKEEYIKQIADEYKSKIPQKLYDAMYKYEVEITD